MKVTGIAGVSMSPEISPEAKGLNRGADVIPGVGLEPTRPYGQGILSPSLHADGSVPTGSRIVANGPSERAGSSSFDPNGDRQPPDKSPDSTMARIRARVTVDARGCWLWGGAKNSRGYGAIGLLVEGRRKALSRSVHRVVAEIVYGGLPAEALVCHTCDVKACCNPEHLYVGDRLSNARDAVERNRTNNLLAKANAAKTHCPKGHAYDEANTMFRPTGERRCRACSRIRDTAARSKTEHATTRLLHASAAAVSAGGAA